MSNIILKFWSIVWGFSRGTFYRDLSDAIDRKVALRDFLQLEIANAKMLDNNSATAVLTALASKLETGDGIKFSDLLAGIAPDSDLLLLASVDEAKKDRHLALLKVADAVEFQIRSLKELGKQLIQPAIAVPIVGFLCIITSEIIASIAESSPASIWVGFNGFVRVLADFINAWALHGALIAAAILTLFVVSLPRWTGAIRLKFDSLPGWSLYRDFNAATVLSSMSMMLSSGKTLNQALEDMALHARPWLRWHIRRMLVSLQENPSDYSMAFAQGLMSKHIRARLASLMASAKSFDQALITLGSKEVARLEENVKTSATALNVSLMSFLVVIAVTLSMGQMTIASALSKAADPSKSRSR